MKKSLMKAWIKNLRSGKYKQGKGRLFQEGETEGHEPEYCCLGVLLDTYIEQNEKTLSNQEIDNLCDALIMGASLSSCRVKSATTGADFFVNKKIGLDDKQESALISFNDTNNWNFKSIARWIETRYLPKAEK